MANGNPLDSVRDLQQSVEEVEAGDDLKHDGDGDEEMQRHEMRAAQRHEARKQEKARKRGGNAVVANQPFDYGSIPGYKPNRKEKEETKFAEPQTLSQKMQEIEDRHPTTDFDNESIAERAKVRNAIGGKIEKCESDYLTNIRALKIHRKMLKGLKDDDSSMLALRKEADLTEKLTDDKAYRMRKKEILDAKRHERNVSWMATQVQIKQQEQDAYDEANQRVREGKRYRRSMNEVD